MAKIGLWTDSHNFPSLPLMKLSAYHNGRGDQIEFLNHLSHYDKVYCSKVFSFTEDADNECVIYADEIHKGGTGYCITLRNGIEVFDKTNDKPLPNEIESMFPDYSLYPEYDFAVGFLTKGCPRGCPFCIVGKHDGRKSYKVADLTDFYRGGQTEIKLLDANILACEEREDLFRQLIESGAWIDFNQGLDIRLMDSDVIRLIDSMNIRRLHFAWDNPKQDLTEQFRLYSEMAKKRNRSELVVYVLVNFNSTLDEDLWRIYTLRDMGFSPYVMIYDKAHASQQKKDLARWCNANQIFRTVDNFEDYKKGQRK